MVIKGIEHFIKADWFSMEKTAKKRWKLYHVCLKVFFLDNKYTFLISKVQAMHFMLKM